MNVLSSGLSVAGNSEAGNAPRRSGADSKANAGFDALLQDKPATQKTDSQTQATNKDARPPRSSSGQKEASRSESDETAPVATASTDEAKRVVAEPSDEAPWPPLGLSAMLTPAPEAAPTKPTVTAQAAPQQANANLPVVGAALPASAAIAAASENAETAALALPIAIAQAADEQIGSKLDVAEALSPSNFGALLQNQTVQDLRATAAGGSAQAPTATPDINSGDFDETFGARVGWLADQKIGHAHIRITPHDLGLVEVKLQLDGDRVHASFSSANADVRQALESSLPRLREMLGEQGLQLAQADVGQQPSSQQQSGDGQSTAGSGFGNGQESGVDMPTPSSQTLRMRGLLDAYA
ncbi:MAG: flagellar hook-length control protein FliK [Stenotrophomonas sp.]|uniref:flagellar hook-length control protein FliK n=1 Tax=Stenotrophomonas sp. TaxID=69392 RepID=UPI003D6CF433